MIGRIEDNHLIDIHLTENPFLRVNMGLVTVNGSVDMFNITVMSAYTASFCWHRDRGQGTLNQTDSHFAPTHPWHPQKMYGCLTNALTSRPSLQKPNMVRMDTLDPGCRQN